METNLLGLEIIMITEYFHDPCRREISQTEHTIKDMSKKQD